MTKHIQGGNWLRRLRGRWTTVRWLMGGVLVSGALAGWPSLVMAATHVTNTSDPDLAAFLGPARPGRPDHWFGSLSIWSGNVRGFSNGGSGNPVVSVPIRGVPGQASIDAEVFGVRTWDANGLASVMVSKIEWSFPGQSTILASYQFAQPLPFATSVDRFLPNNPTLHFIDPFAEGYTQDQVFANYFNGPDTLTGAGAADVMRGGASDDTLEGQGGADTLQGDEGNDTFIYTPGTAPLMETIFGNAGADKVRLQGSQATGILQANSVDISNLIINSVEEIQTNGAEGIITFSQLSPGGFATITGKNNAMDVITIRGVSMANISALLTFNSWESQDLVGIIGTVAVDSVTGTNVSDVFVGYGADDIFHGANGDDTFLIAANETAPRDQFFGDAGDDTLQVDGQLFSQVGQGAKTDLRYMVLDKVEALALVKGQVIVSAKMLSGTILDDPHMPLSGKINEFIGQGKAAAPAVLEIWAEDVQGIDLKYSTFKDWNDGFYHNDVIRILAGPNTAYIRGALNEENYISAFRPEITNCTSGTTYIVGGNLDDEIYGSCRPDYIPGSAGDDDVHGAAGADQIGGFTGNDTLSGDAGDDVLGGGDDDDILRGGPGRDTLIGSNGNDRLDGGTDFDILGGNAGNDKFIFSKQNIISWDYDVIVDFAPNEDQVCLNKRSFPSSDGQGSGSLNAGAFRLGKDAVGSRERVLYDNSTGLIRFDPDGSGPGASQVVALLNNHALISSSDICVE